MARHEGFVATLKKDGIAEVVIQPVTAGVPGASARVNHHVCHCVAEGSTVTIEALNAAGAAVGDYVSVRRDTSALIKNAAALLGIPLMGLLSGILLGALLTDAFSSHMATGIIAIVAFLIVGLVIGFLIFRRISPGNAPVIEKIIEKNWRGGPLSIGNQVFSADLRGDCNTCAGPFSEGPMPDRRGY